MSNHPYQARIVVDRPVAEVFYWAANAQHFPLWAGAAAIEVIKELPVREGSQYELIHATLLSRKKTPITITHFQPPNRFTVQDTSTPAQVQFMFSFGRVEGGTEVTLECQSAGRPISGLMAGLATRHQLDTFLANLQKHLGAGQTN